MKEWSPELFLKDLKIEESKKGVDSAIELALQVTDYFLLLCKSKNEANAAYALGEFHKILDLLYPFDHDPAVLWSILLQAWNGQRVGVVYEPFLNKIEKYFKENRFFEKEGFDSEEQFKNVRGKPEGLTLGDLARAYGGNPNIF